MFGWFKVFKKKFDRFPGIVQFIIAILLIFVIRWLIKVILYSNFASTYLENFGTPKSLIYFHMEECGHCKKFTPEWEKFVQGYKGDLKIQKLERKEAGEGMLQKYKIQGFPTVLLIDENGQKKAYEGERTSSGLKQFIGSK